ncbi:MAG: DEAD/DEAH box helicase [archaeon]|nr:DEAD/DEAH box helicase [archaeon]
MKNFNALGLDQTFQKVLDELGFDEITEIQEKVIPLAVAGKDLIAGSATGSGKTLAFGFPIIEKLKVRGGLQALILTPTRDLAEQIAKSLKMFAKYKPLKIATIYGGVPISPQMDDLERADIAVGTPGRILDHLSRRSIDLSKIKIFVLDEADRMLDMGFIKDVTDIIYPLPKNRQTLLFSATISHDIRKIADKYMNNPVEISAESYVDASKLKQVFYDVPQREKFSLLVHLLKNEDSKLVMVFCNTKRTADFVGDNLKEHGFDALALHGNLNQNQRKRVLETFHRSEKFILVCTDIASRGLDIKNVSHIYNYDTSKVSTDYVHRIGRTARAGKEGKAITLLSELDYDNFRKIKNNASLYIEQIKLPEFEKIMVTSQGHDSRRGQWGRGQREVRRDGGRSGGSYGSGRSHREGEPRASGEGRNRPFRRRPSKPGEARQSSGNRTHKRFDRNHRRGRG